MNSDQQNTFLPFNRRHRTIRWSPHGQPSLPPPPPPPPRTRLSTFLLQRFKKPNPKLLSFLLQALIMFLVITVFFLFIGFAAIFLVHICIVSRTLHGTRSRPIAHLARFSYTVQDDEFYYFDSTGLSLVDIQKLPLVNYVAVVESVTTRDCAVCLDGFRAGEGFRILPRCKHAFHANCIDPWLIKASACPICRGVVELED